MSNMHEEWRPYCGVELLPHAVWLDGSPAPVTCDLPPHGKDAWHCNEENETAWAWQDKDGSWILGAPG